MSGNGANANELVEKKSNEMKAKAQEKNAAEETPQAQAKAEPEGEVEQRIVLTYEPLFIRRLIEMLERELPMQKARSYVETLEAAPMVPMTITKRSE